MYIIGTPNLHCTNSVSNAMFPKLAYSWKIGQRINLVIGDGVAKLTSSTIWLLCHRN